jgi:predicted dehydrogenase
VERWQLLKDAGGLPTINGGDVEVINEEPLKLELADFVDAVASRRPPAVTGEDGRRALGLADAITRQIALANA